MSKIEDGGPAFPQPLCDTGTRSGIVTANEVDAGGMSLRDFYAGQAMLMKFGASGSAMSKDQMAVECWDMADAMLRARNQPQEQQQ